MADVNKKSKKKDKEDGDYEGKRWSDRGKIYRSSDDRKYMKINMHILNIIYRRVKYAYDKKVPTQEMFLKFINAGIEQKEDKLNEERLNRIMYTTGKSYLPEKVIESLTGRMGIGREYFVHNETALFDIAKLKVEDWEIYRDYVRKAGSKDDNIKKEIPVEYHKIEKRIQGGIKSICRSIDNNSGIEVNDTYKMVYYIIKGKKYEVSLNVGELMEKVVLRLENLSYNEMCRIKIGDLMQYMEKIEDKIEEINIVQRAEIIKNEKK